MQPEAIRFLPHRHPFLFLDVVTDRQPGVSATATRLVTANDPCGSNIFLVEAMAQLAGVAVACAEGEGGFLASIDHAELAGAMEPGDTLDISVRVVKSFGRLHLIEGTVHAGGRLLAMSQLTIGVGPVVG